MKIISFLFIVLFNFTLLYADSLILNSGTVYNDCLITGLNNGKLNLRIKKDEYKSEYEINIAEVKSFEITSNEVKTKSEIKSTTSKAFNNSYKTNTEVESNKFSANYKMNDFNKFLSEYPDLNPAPDAGTYKFFVLYNGSKWNDDMTFNDIQPYFTKGAEKFQKFFEAVREYKIVEEDEDIKLFNSPYLYSGNLLSISLGVSIFRSVAGTKTVDGIEYKQFVTDRMYYSEDEGTNVFTNKFKILLPKCLYEHFQNIEIGSTGTLFYGKVEKVEDKYALIVHGIFTPNYIKMLTKMMNK